MISIIMIQPWSEFSITHDQLEYYAAGYTIYKTLDVTIGNFVANWSNKSGAGTLYVVNGFTDICIE